MVHKLNSGAMEIQYERADGVGPLKYVGVLIRVHGWGSG